MIFSYKELKRIANLSEQTSLDDVLKAINSIGFEVEGTEKFADVEGIKFGKVLSISKNPNADKLNVAEIEFSDKKRIIQTNATNVKEGMTVVAFVPGSRSGDIVFDSKEMQGIVSEGMLSSLNEFGISKDLLRDGMTEGIQAYEDVSLDMDPVEYLGLNDTLIDIDILSNRSDAQSYYIMANEIAAYFGTTPIEISTKDSTFDSNITVTPARHEELSLIEGKGKVNISLADQVLLAKSGIKSINDIVDLTNLTLIMTGQPTHAYDKRSVGTNFSTSLSSIKVNVFGNKEVQLDNDLVITSDDKPVSLAGVIGFEETGVLSDTNEFVLELGRFNIKEVRKALKTIKMTTTAGIQSSKNLGKGTTELAIKYISSKLDEFSGVVNFNYPKQKQVPFSTVKLSQVAGFNIVDESRYSEAINSLEILGFKVLTDKITVPSYRYDIESQQDLNEEILRFFGYDNLPLSAPKLTGNEVKIIKDNKKQVAAMGYFETYTYSLISKEKNIFNPFGFTEAITLQTFVSKEREVIRNSQIVSLLEVVEYNSKRNIPTINIFSEGMINDGVKTLGLASTTKSFIEMKQDIVNIIPEEAIFVKTKDEMLHPGVSADILLNGEKIGFIGKVNPKVINDQTLIAEIIIKDWDKEVAFKEYDSAPLKNRDVTFELAKGENIASYISDVKVNDIKVIDTFEKDNINKVTVRFTGTNEQIKLIDDKYNK